MSETMGPFNTAIEILADHQRSYLDNNLQDYAREMGVGIRVLEAAGKVDKKESLSCFSCAWEYCFAPFACDIDNTGKICRESKKQIHALLESLPDKEKP